MKTTIEPLLEILRSHIASAGLKSSKQRELIARVFFESGGHSRVEDVLENARKLDDRVSQATVYRTMKFLSECGLAKPRHFHGGQTLYELTDEHRGAHHDHLICTQCKKIVEFVDPRIETLQEEVAKQYKFSVTDHRLELYGVCAACKK